VLHYEGTWGTGGITSPINNPSTRWRWVGQLHLQGKSSWYPLVG